MRTILEDKSDLIKRMDFQQASEHLHKILDKAEGAVLAMRQFADGAETKTDVALFRIPLELAEFGLVLPGVDSNFRSHVMTLSVILNCLEADLRYLTSARALYKKEDPKRGAFKHWDGWDLIVIRERARITEELFSDAVRDTRALLAPSERDELEDFLG